jgi:REP element-mobilizing transposase RayT
MPWTLPDNAGAVFSLKYHIVWCPKYRRKVLIGDVETRLKNVLLATAAQYGVLIEVMEVMPDHVKPATCIMRHCKNVGMRTERIGNHSITTRKRTN